MEINNLGKYRYSITNLLNDGQESFALPMPSCLKMATTYQNLIDHHLLQLKETCKLESLQQIQRNHRTALRVFLNTLQKAESSPVGTELAEDFDVALRNHLTVSGLSERSQIDRKSLLTQWRNSYASMNSAPTRVGRDRTKASDIPIDQNPFEKALWGALKAKKLAPKTAAKRSGVSCATMSRWTRGAIPNARTVPALGKLEETLGVEKGVLTNAFIEATRVNEAPYTDEFRERLKEQQKLLYKLSGDSVSAELKTEWANFLKYKTSKVGNSLKRSKRAGWSLMAPSDTTTEPSFFCSVGTMVCPTAAIVWDQVAYFLGFLKLSRDSGGYGVGQGEEQTLAWLAVPEAVDAYMQFRTQRSAGLIHGGQKGIAVTVMAFTHPITGYLTQQPAFEGKLPEYALVEQSWVERCGDAMQVASQWKSEAQDQSRDPSAPIQFLLDREDPFAPIFSAMKKLRMNGDKAKPNSLAEAVARRNELLLGILLSNPLRCKNVILLTYHENNTGNVYQTASGQWRIRIRGRMFKNKRRVGALSYDVPVARWLWRLLDDYIKFFRPILVAGQTTNHLLVSKNGKRFDALDKQVRVLTKLLIPNCGGFGPHAFRHLVATDWLTKNHNDFLTVAELLNDTIAVVMKNYAHLKKDVAFARYEAHIEKSLPSAMYS